MKNVIRKNIIRAASVAVLYVAALLLSGCVAVTTTEMSRFYVLTPMAEAEPEYSSSMEGTDNFSIGIGPISLPKYLKRSQIVTRTGNNELYLAEFDRWAGKIEEDIGRVIAENLALMLSNDSVIVHRTGSAMGTDFTIELDMSRFEGSLGGSVVLVARWVIIDRHGSTLKNITSTRIEKPVLGSGYPELVEAQSRTLAALSRNLAAAIRDLTGK